MFYVPLYIEGLRSRPRLVFWLAVLAQAALWVIVPMVFYAAPPGELAQLLAVAHEPSLRDNVGPPLAYWLAEIAFRIAGLFGVYLLSQICVIATLWCVFALGRAIVGATHAVMAVLLMVGIFAFTVPTPNFGPPILAMALWAATLLFYWRAVAQRRRQYWYALAGAAACLLITTDVALILLGVLVLFTAMTKRGRAAADTFEAWVAAAAVAGMVFVHFVLLERAGVTLAPTMGRLRIAGIAGDESPATTPRRGCGSSACSSSRMPASLSSWRWRLAGRAPALLRRRPLPAPRSRRSP
jgi:hypothetical protein